MLTQPPHSEVGPFYLILNQSTVFSNKLPALEGPTSDFLLLLPEVPSQSDHLKKTVQVYLSVSALSSAHCLGSDKEVRVWVRPALLKL